jgi:hypothetical protein
MASIPQIADSLEALEMHTSIVSVHVLSKNFGNFGNGFGEMRSR